MKKGISNYRKHISSTVLTMLVISLLLISVPVTAINVGINNLHGTYKQGKQIQFKVDVEINKGNTEGELLTIQYTNVTFTLPDSSEKTCKVLNNETVEGCDFLSVEDKHITGNNNYGYGYGYGYDNGVKYELGYGYGYGYGSQNTHVKYKFIINTSKLSQTGKYSAVADVYAGTTSPRIFSSETTNFRLFAKSPEGKKEYTETESKKYREINAYNETGIMLSINTNSSISGSVKIEKYNDNIVEETKGVLTLKTAGKFIDITVDENITNSLTNATIKIYYTNSELAHAGIKESSLAVYYWNPATDTWENVGGTLGSDSNGKYILVVVNHFSLYGLFGSPPDETTNEDDSGSSNTGGYTIVLNMETPKTVNIEAGTTESFNINVKANHLALNTILSITELPQEWITISPASADIPTNGEQKYIVTLDIPEEETGKRTITATATSGSKTISEDINVIITEPQTSDKTENQEIPKTEDETKDNNSVTNAGPTGMFLGVENTTWAGIIIGLAILGLLVYIFRKRKK